MATILRNAGLQVYVGRYKVRVENCSHFVFQEYGGDLGEPSIDAEAETLDEMMRDAKLVSDALAEAGVRHRFGLYDGSDEMVGYFHYNWPLGDDDY